MRSDTCVSPPGSRSRLFHQHPRKLPRFSLLTPSSLAPDNHEGQARLIHADRVCARQGFALCAVWVLLALLSALPVQPPRRGSPWQVEPLPVCDRLG